MTLFSLFKTRVILIAQLVLYFFFLFLFPSHFDMTIDTFMSWTTVTVMKEQKNSGIKIVHCLIYTGLNLQTTSSSHQFFSLFTA